MGLDFVNPHVTKILLAVEDGDSINKISKKTGGSYGWTYEWIERLEDIDVIERDGGIRITDQKFVDEFRSVARTVFSRNIELNDAYLLPNFSGMDYRYSRTDAAFVWTRGGYQIGRNQDDYPIFIDVYEEELGDWKAFLDSYHVDFEVEDRIEGDGIYFVLFPQQEFTSDWVENASVMPLDETVEWMREYEVNFQPALEMLDEMYDLDLGVTYRERNVL